MNKLLTLSVTLLSALLLTACGGNKVRSNTSSTSASVSESKISSTSASSTASSNQVGQNEQTKNTTVNLTPGQKQQINNDFLNWAAQRAEIGHMAVSDWYFDHGAAGNGDWYANTPDGRVQVQDNGNPGAAAFKIHSVGGCVFYTSNDGGIGKQDLYQGYFAQNYTVGVNMDKPISKYMLGDNGVVYELKTGNGTPASTNTGFGQMNGTGTSAYAPDQNFQISNDSAAQSELKSLLSNYE